MRQLAGKRVLVTGGGRGIGRALSLRFADAGSHLLVADIDPATAGQTAAEIVDAGGTAVPLTIDVTDAATIGAARSAALAEGGPIDVLVNNAGVVRGGAFLDVPATEHLDTLRVNALGLVAVTHAFLPDLIARPDAHVVNIVSASAFVGLPFGTSYAASKWAALGFSESIRLELRETGNAHVRVTSVCPGYVDTGMFSGVKPPAFTRMLTPEQLAAQVVRSVQRDRAFLKTPWLIRTGPLLRGLLPTAAFDRVAAALGINTSMRDWQGHPPAAVSDPDSASAE